MSFKNPPSKDFESDDLVPEFSVKEWFSMPPGVTTGAPSPTHEPTSHRAANDYSALGTYSQPRGEKTTVNKRRPTGMMNPSSLFRKQESKLQNTTANRKKTTRLFNV